ncbi:MAG: YbaK/EbsC family protein [Spirochaetales bacterium]|jgi:Cys-tRNA(Pro) deacylase|nr:YbaK/EbsC family protein [Exilispira sp.]NMC68281.1 YbaK/EbsC family protein [Spirochaetales bacterium]
MSDRVIKQLEKQKLDTEIIIFDQTTKTAKDAALALNCKVSQIVKSLVFKIKNEDEPIIILVSGANRVDEIKVSQIIGKQIEKADADFVRDRTGFAIGGVPPIGHKNIIDIYMDKELLNFKFVWAAAGTPNSVFKISSNDLLEITKAKIIEVK